MPRSLVARILYAGVCPVPPPPPPPPVPPPPDPPPSDPPDEPPPPPQPASTSNAAAQSAALLNNVWLGMSPRFRRTVVCAGWTTAGSKINRGFRACERHALACVPRDHRFRRRSFRFFVRRAERQAHSNFRRPLRCLAPS